MSGNLAEQLAKSVRPLVTFTIAATFCVAFACGLVSERTFSEVVVMVLSFWFGQRSGEKSAEAAQQIAVAAQVQAQQQQPTT